MLDEGISLFESRPDKRWGLTDCISFEVMTVQGAVDALSADHHFEQAGFRALLRLAPPT
jgi:predicted nucleic acid-binding protein